MSLPVKLMQPIKQTELKLVLQTARQESKPLVITLKPGQDAIFGALNLLAMNGLEMIQLDKDDAAKMAAISDPSKNPIQPRDLKAKVTLSESFPEKWFINRLCDFIHDIEVST